MQTVIGIWYIGPGVTFNLLHLVPPTLLISPVHHHLATFHAIVVIVFYPHMSIGMLLLWIYRLLFVLCVCVSVSRIFCKGYLGRGLA